MFHCACLDVANQLSSWNCVCVNRPIQQPVWFVVWVVSSFIARQIACYTTCFLTFYCNLYCLFKFLLIYTVTSKEHHMNRDSSLRNAQQCMKMIFLTLNKMALYSNVSITKLLTIVESCFKLKYYCGDEGQPSFKFVTTDSPTHLYN